MSYHNPRGRLKKCRCCKKWSYPLHKHHKWPRSIFGDNNDTELICVNCHAKLHNSKFISLQHLSRRGQLLSKKNHRLTGTPMIAYKMFMGGLKLKEIGRVIDYTTTGTSRLIRVYLDYVNLFNACPIVEPSIEERLQVPVSAAGSQGLGITRKFNNEEVETILKLKDLGMRYRDIAAQVNRSYKSIESFFAKKRYLKYSIQ